MRSRMLVVLSTPKGTRVSSFVVIDPATHQVQRSVPTNGTIDGHDVIAVDSTAYTVSTGSGEIQAYDATSLKMIGSCRLWTRYHHLNTIAPAASSLLVMAHNLAHPSTIYEVDPQCRSTNAKYTDIGRHAHGVDVEIFVVLLGLWRYAESWVWRSMRIDKNGDRRAIWTCDEPCRRV